MDNFIIKRGIKIYRTPEQMAELEELERMKANRLRRKIFSVVEKNLVL